ncbi:MAG: hypothetical protein GYA31_01370 [Parcubacteria group bacterium]|nr:hypothetical protein [Parcubacteria group bacterium]
MPQKSTNILNKKKNIEERQNEYFKKMLPSTKLRATLSLVELCLKLNKLSKSYDPGRTTR